MAPNKKPGPGEPERQEEMTVVVLKFKGGSQSLQKGFDAVSQAIAALGPAQSHVNHRTVISRPPAELPAGNGDVIDADAHEQPQIDDGEVDAAAAETSEEAGAARVKKPPRYTFMDDFNLAPSGQPSLKDYCIEKNPQTDNDKVLVASAWITKHGGEELFTGGHLFTCFRAMEWKPQVDMTQPLRKLKFAKSYFDNPSVGKWKLTGIGLEAADKVGKS